MRKLLQIIAFLLLASGPAMAEADYAYHSDELAFHYPATDYKRKFSISLSSYASKSYTVQLSRINSSETDDINICSSNLLKCAQYSAMYDINEDTETGLVLGQFTEKVYKKKLKGWTLFESTFLVATDGPENGLNSQYYKAVLTKKNKTVVLAGLLGKANDCRPTEKCWIPQIKRFKSIIDSIIQNN